MSDTRHKLEATADLLNAVRSYFAACHVLEVQTPLLETEGVTAPHIAQFSVVSANQQAHGFLQTSPEYAMKRLLSEEAGDIYQICKAFRAGEIGPRHKPEFLMLEWYRIGFNLDALMEDVANLLCEVLGQLGIQTTTYQDAFKTCLDLDPLTCSDTDLFKAILDHIPNAPNLDWADRDTLLDLLFSHCIQPTLGHGYLHILTHFPLSQASLAKASTTHPGCAERFETFYQGIELANGYHELSDPTELTSRFESDNQTRRTLHLPEIPLPATLLTAMQTGFPDCAGVALGLERLLMLKMGWDQIPD